MTKGRNTKRRKWQNVKSDKYEQIQCYTIQVFLHNARNLAQDGRNLGQDARTTLLLPKLNQKLFILGEQYTDSSGIYSTVSIF